MSSNIFQVLLTFVKQIKTKEQFYKKKILYIRVDDMKGYKNKKTEAMLRAKKSEI